MISVSLSLMATSPCTLYLVPGNLMSCVISRILVQMVAPLYAPRVSYPVPVLNLVESERNFFHSMYWSYSLLACKVSSCAATNEPRVSPLVNALMASCSVICTSYWMDSFIFQYSAMGAFLDPPKGVAALGSYA